MGKSAERPEIVRRQVSIDFNGLPPMPWRRHSAAELWLKAACVIFPLGERFFIDSVRACQDRATDPVLREEIRSFIHQEAMHGKVHDDCTVVLARDYPAMATVAWLCGLTVMFLKSLPRTLGLSVTAATEHFTAISAERAFELEDQFREALPGAFVDMWMWHAVEETEHKAVCFDLHRACVGTGLYGYVHRIAGAFIATVWLGCGIVVFPWLLRRGLHAEREKKLPKSKPRNDFNRPFEMSNPLLFMAALVPWRHYATYFRPSFHPWQHDNSDRVRQWRKRNPQFGSSSGLRTESTA